MDFKKTNAEPSTVTRDIRKFDGPTGNIYESISIISKRANQISSEMKEELSAKLAEFASNSDSFTASNLATFKGSKLSYANL